MVARRYVLSFGTLRCLTPISKSWHSRSWSHSFLSSSDVCRHTGMLSRKWAHFDGDSSLSKVRHSISNLISLVQESNLSEPSVHRQRNTRHECAEGVRCQRQNGWSRLVDETLDKPPNSKALARSGRCCGRNSVHSETEFGHFQACVRIVRRYSTFNNSADQLTSMRS